MNGYICLYHGKKYEVYADSTFEAQKKCAVENKIKKSYEISVYLAEKDSVPVGTCGGGLNDTRRYPGIHLFDPL